MAEISVTRRGFVGKAIVAGTVTWTVGSGLSILYGSDRTSEDGTLRKDLKVNSVCTFCPEHCPVHIRVVDGIPRKVEGRDLDPLRFGGICGIGQVLTQHLFHPDRLKYAKSATEKVDISSALSKLNLAIERSKNPALISGDIFSIEHEILADKIASRNGKTYVSYRKYHGNEYRALRKLAGKPVWPIYRLRKADVVIMWGTTLHDGHLGRAAVMRELTLLRRGRADFRGKVVSINPHFDIGALKSDLHIDVSPGHDGELLASIETLLHGGEPDIEGTAQRIGTDPNHVAALFRIFTQYKRILFVVGRGVSEQPNGQILTERILFLNKSLAGESLELVPIKEVEFDDRVGDEHDLVVSLSSNYLYDYSGNPERVQNFRRIPYKVAIGNYDDEIAQTADLFLPLGHPLERTEIRVSPIAESGQILVVQTPKLLEENVLQSSDLAEKLGSKIDASRFLKSWTGQAVEASKEGFEYVPIFSPVLQIVHSPDDGEIPKGLPSEQRPLLSLLSYAPQNAVSGDAVHLPDLLETYGNVFLEGWHSWLEISQEDAARYRLFDKKKAHVTWKGGAFDIKIRINKLQSSGYCFIPEGLGHPSGSRYSAGVGINAFALLRGPRIPIPIEIRPS